MTLRALALGLGVMLVVLQYRLWVGEGSLAEVWALKGEVHANRQENEQLAARNQRLEAEVIDLKEGEEVAEDRARRVLGMIHQDETFFQIVERRH